MYLIFDGGNGASLDKEAYGSYKIDNNEIQRVVFGKGYTNNEAEYKTLIFALAQIILNNDASVINLTIEGDSELVRNQIGVYQDYNWSGWKVNVAHLLTLRDLARELLIKFNSFTYNHIPRKEVVKILGH